MVKKTFLPATAI